MLRPMTLSTITALALLTLTTPAAAQVTLEQLDAAADAKDASMEEFRKRLNDPDPDRALAALHLLVSKGDADQRRMAIRNGLQSTDRAIRATTLRAIFDSEPSLRAVFDPVAEEPTVYYSRTVHGNSGIIDADGTASVTFKVNGYDAENACWTHKRQEYCLLRLRGDIVSLNFGDSWGTYTLNGSGQLVGEQAINQNLTKAVIDLSE